MRKIIFITGATSGFGKAIAEKFASQGADLIITGRRVDRLTSLQQSLQETYKVDVLPLTFDVQVNNEVKAVIGKLPERWQKVNILVNNAGLALGRDYFEEASMDDWETMIDTNLKGLIYVTRAVLPHLIGTDGAHIINIGSIAGKEVYEKGNVYCATKAAVDALSQGMRIDLVRHGIKVTAIHPGAANTEFSKVRFKGDEDTASKVYQGYQPLAAEDIADICYYCSTLPPHVCINDLVVTSTAQASATITHKR